MIGAFVPWPEMPYPVPPKLVYALGIAAWIPTLFFVTASSIYSAYEQPIPTTRTRAQAAAVHGMATAAVGIPLIWGCSLMFGPIGAMAGAIVTGALSKDALR